MFKGSTLTLTTANTLEKLAAGRIVLPKGKAMRGMRFKVTVPLKNTRASSVTTALTTAQRKEMLNNLQLTFKYGAGQQHQVCSALPGNRLRQIQRYCYGSEMEGYTDSTTGMAQTLTNGGTTNLVFYPIIPTGAFHQFRGRRRRLWGVGRSQALTIELQVKFVTRTPCSTSGSTDTALAIDGNVTMELMPDCFSCKGDVWAPLWKWDEYTEKDKRFKAQTGLPLLLAELSAAHASSVSTNVSIFVGDELIHDQVSAGEIRQELLDNPELLAEADVSDEVTVLYSRQPGDEFSELPPGDISFVQNVKDLSEAVLGVLQIPIISDEEGRKDVAAVAKLRGKPVRAVSAATALNYGDDVPGNLRFAVPWIAYDRDDTEFEQFAGLVAQADSAVVAETVPGSVLDRGRALHKDHVARGETKLAEGVTEAISLAIPFAQQNAKGIKGGGSKVASRVRESLSS